MKLDTIATRYSFWDTVRPMSALHEQLPFARTFTREEYYVIARGLVPAGMDDRWFIFLENDQLYFHRSWTGTCIYQITLDRTDGDSIVVTEALVNRDPDEYKIADDEFDVALLSFLIDNLLLGRRAHLPARRHPSGA
ncbi:MAG: hypothetical protein ACT4OT_11865 [Acidobacteriota bacterium]